MDSGVKFWTDFRTDGLPIKPKLAKIPSRRRHMSKRDKATLTITARLRGHRPRHDDFL